MSEKVSENVPGTVSEKVPGTRSPQRFRTLLGASFLGRHLRKVGRSPWTRPGPGGHAIEPGRSGTLAIANSGSPGSWGSPRAIRRRVLRLGTKKANSPTILDTFLGRIKERQCPGRRTPRAPSGRGSGVSGVRATRARQVSNESPRLFFPGRRGPPRVSQLGPSPSMIHLPHRKEPAVP